MYELKRKIKNKLGNQKYIENNIQKRQKINNKKKKLTKKKKKDSSRCSMREKMTAKHHLLN